MNIIILGDDDLHEFVWKRRQKRNTLFIKKTLEDIHNQWFY